MEILRWPKGGLNLDDSVELMDTDDWSYAANIVSGRSYASKNGEKENILGNAALASGVDLTGCEHIGTIRAAEDDTSYLFFYHATPANQCIVKFHAGVISLVLKWDGLNFSNLKEHRINGGGIANDLLYFTDNYNRPRCVHLTRYSGGSTPTNEEEILHIKRGPLYAPEIDEASFSGGTDKPIDDVQFALQYKYTDGQYSVISPWSKLVRGLGMDGVSGALSTVSLRVNANEAVPALVDRVLLVARKGNNGVPFYWLEEDDITQTTYDYVYTEQILGVVPDIYLKPFDLVPLRAKSSSITKSRAWFANYLEGYNTPLRTNFVDALNMTLNVVDTTVEDEGPTLSPNSRFKCGVVYHDEQGQSCGVIDGWEFSTPKAISRDTTRKKLEYSITGSGLVNIPSWARYFSFVMTKDLIKSWFIQNNFTATDVDPTDDRSPYVSVDSTGTETLSMTYNSIQSYLRLNMGRANRGGIYYSFKEGDYAIVTNEDAGVTVGPLKVRKIDGLYIYVDIADLGNAGVAFECSFQIYTPNTNEEQIYYEIDRRPITFPAGVPTLDTTTFTWLGDTSNVAWDPFNPSLHTQQMRVKINDGDWETDSGKPYVKTYIGQVHKKNFIRFSSPFIAGINVNGLSEFNTGDEDNVPIESVEIQRLQPTSLEATGGNVLLAICNSDTYSVYIDEARMSTNDGQNLIINSVDVIGDVRKQASGFGTLHPESVIEENGTVYWWDQYARSFVRYSSNGIFPISEYKVVSHFEQQAKLNSEDDIVVCGYDPFYKMVVVTFKNADTNTRKTIGFCEPLNRWVSFYDFAPEGYIIGSNKMYSIQSGVVYSHDDSSNFNRFYTVDNNSKITLSFNDAPADPKEWKIFWAQLSANFFEWAGADQFIADDAMRVDISNRFGQATSILYNEFGIDENLVYGEIRGDENSPGGVLDGDPIYGSTMQAQITFSGGTYKQLLFAKAGVTPSRGHIIS